MVTRREWLGITVGAGATLAMTPRLLSALQQGTLIQRAIPSSGERLPVVGLGSAYSFSDVARREDVEALREVIKTLVEKGGKVLDTAPGYGASEEVSGRLASELGVSNKIFWATKVNVASVTFSCTLTRKRRAQASTCTFIEVRPMLSTSV